MATNSEILLVHGGPGMDESYFLPYLAPLKPRLYRQRRKATVDELCQELFQHAVALPPGSTLAGHSWGAMLILETLRRYSLPDIGNLVLMACGFDSSLNEAFARHKTSWSRREVKTVPKSADEGMRVGCLQLIELFFSPSFTDEGARIFERMDLSADSTFFFDEYLSQFDLKPVLGGLKIPVLNLYGEKDWRIPAEHTKRAAQLNPLIENAAIASAGHFPFVEAPDECLRRIQHFLRK